MKLSQLAAKPKLIPFVLDDEELIKEFGEPIEFYSYDRQPLEVFMKLATLDQSNLSSMFDIIRKLILDEDGKEIVDTDNMLPSKVLIKAIQKIVETLGK